MTTSMATRAAVSSARVVSNPTSIGPTRSPLAPPPSALPFPCRALPRGPARGPGIRVRRPGSSLRGSAGEPAEGLDDGFFEGGGPMMEDESDDEEDAESSADLLIRFLQSMFKKAGRRAKKASRSVLPDAIPPQLVSFAVDGILLLASLSILKALLEVACTLGGSVFVVILLLRVIWAAVSYFQSNGGGLNQGGNTFGAAQPI
ncbi:protein SHORT HYPOCOTYL IN WHITE LIGHT 1-like isoform X2 [Syzygium oleosum]|uniref:protein SHORT HYPOCOTYL IN WHITE LIGHT 1-like isoform X2 n=1 Tax=Syzygium oleosum TaxID=219896 RepID=UPI0011D25F74|nr:protein SHORT HYPOCOTYL IN WHITE LIGHT 1-like isoform X2 [Syzygium oleosum]